jgi:hypothetical protein
MTTFTGPFPAISLVPGDDWEEEITIKDSDGQVVDLSARPGPMPRSNGFPARSPSIATPIVVAAAFVARFVAQEKLK